MNSKIEFLNILKLRWERYDLMLIKTRDNCSTRNVHDLRVAIRRLGAILDFMPWLISKRKESHSLKLKVERLYRFLGPLRDQQMAKEMSVHNKGLKPLPIRLTKIQLKVAVHLRQVDLHQQAAWMDVIEAALRVKKIGHFKKRLGQLTDRLKKKIDRLKVKLKKTSLQKEKRIHQIRRKAKIIGYHNEILNQFDVSELTKFEKQAGMLQNLRVLKKIIQAYSHGSDQTEKIRWMKNKRKKTHAKILRVQRNLK